MNLVLRETGAAPGSQTAKPKLPSAVLKPFLAPHLACRKRELDDLCGDFVMMDEFCKRVRRIDEAFSASETERAIAEARRAAGDLRPVADLEALHDITDSAVSTVASETEISQITAAMCDAIPTFDPMKAPGYLDALLFTLETECADKAFCPHAIAGAVYQLARAERFVPEPDKLLKAIRSEHSRYMIWRDKISDTLAGLARLNELKETPHG